MWLQRWLGEIYSSLYRRFGTNVFSFEGAHKLLNLKEPNLHVAFSMLHDAGLS